MNLTYPEVFELRGHSYHDAMLAWPAARDAEFTALFSRNPMPLQARVFDIPAGGGYLKRVLPACARVLGLELAANFGGALEVYHPGLPWSHGEFDRGVCLAALHHIDDPSGFLSSLLRGLVPEGILHIADVSADSPIAEFLDGFVGRYNTTGHDGTYLRETALPLPPRAELLGTAVIEVPWVFPSEDAMVRFCTQLFGLRNCPPRVLLDALDRFVGIQSASNAHSLQWKLLYADLRIRTP